MQSIYYQDLTSTAFSRNIFCDKYMFTSWIQAEKALIYAHSKVNSCEPILLQEAEEKWSFEALDYSRIQSRYKQIGFPILPFVESLRAISSDKLNKWVHKGATTQDIIDTGLVIQVSAILTECLKGIEDIILLMTNMMKKYKKTVMVGRTFQQYASPITFGYKVAVWLSELLWIASDLRQLKGEICVGQLGGAVGNLNSYGENGPDLCNHFCDYLDLSAPNISWHTSRYQLFKLICLSTSLTSFFAKIANEVVLLMRTEVQELSESYTTDRGASSAMPQKRNPTISPILISLGKTNAVAPAAYTACLQQEHERGVDAQTIESDVIPSSMHKMSCAIENGKSLLEGLKINEDQMLENFQRDGGYAMSESLQSALGSVVGAQQAKKISQEVVQYGIDNNLSLHAAVSNFELKIQSLDKNDLLKALVPENYLGASSSFVDNIEKRVGAFNG